MPFIVKQKVGERVTRSDSGESCAVEGFSMCDSEDRKFSYSTEREDTREKKF